MALKNVEVAGKMQHLSPGDVIEVGKQIGMQWIAQGEAIETTVKPMSKVSILPSIASDWQFTIFAVPRTFEGIIGIWQRNAIHSWQQMEPRPEILLLYDDEGVAQAAKKLQCRWYRDCKRNEYGTPLISSIFEIGQREASHELVCYVNSDIILLGLAEAIRVCADRFEQFLMVGRRWDADITIPIKFSKDWKGKMRRLMKRGATQHSAGAIDYFAFRKGLYTDVPDFAIGRSAWDNWLVSHVVQRGIPVIDTSNVVLPIHQEKPKRVGPPISPERKIERMRNRAFYDRDCQRVKGTTKNAPWVLSRKGLERRF